HTDPSFWRLSRRARDQRGHGGGSAAVGGRWCASSSHPPNGRARGGDGAHRVRGGRAFGRCRAVPLRHGRATPARGRNRLPRRREGSRGQTRRRSSSIGRSSWWSGGPAKAGRHEGRHVATGSYGASAWRRTKAGSYVASAFSGTMLGKTRRVHFVGVGGIGM